MIIAFIGTSCVGKTTLMNFFNREYGWSYLTNYTSRYARIGENTKSTLSIQDFDKMKSSNQLIFINNFYKDSYGYLREEVDNAVFNKTSFWMLDFGIENIHQLDTFPNIIKIIILPKNEEQLVNRIKMSDRENRLPTIISNFRANYSKLSEGYDTNLEAFCVINEEGILGVVIHKILKHISNCVKEGIINTAATRNDRLHKVISSLDQLPKAKSGLEAYKQISDLLNFREDILWGKTNWSPPRTFLDGHRTDRLYTIYTESFYPVKSFSGVTLLLSKKELLFLSRYGAIELQNKEITDPYGEINHFQHRINQVIYKKNDFMDDGVWHMKNC